MKVPKRTLLWIYPIGLTLSLIGGLIRRDADLLAVSFLALAFGIGWLFFYLIAAAKVPGVLVKIIFGWAVLFVLTGAIRDSFLLDHLPEFNSNALHPSFAMVLFFVLPMVFVFFALGKKFTERMAEIGSEPVNNQPPEKRQ